MTFLTGTLDPSCLALSLDLLCQVLPVAVYAKPVPTAHRIALKIIPFVAADVTHEPGDRLCPRGTLETFPQPRLFKRLILMLHVPLDQLFLLPPGKSKQDRRRLWRQAEDGGNLVNLYQLFTLNIGGSQDLELDFVWLALLLKKIFVIRKASVEVTEIYVTGTVRSATVSSASSDLDDHIANKLEFLFWRYSQTRTFT